MRVYNNYLMSKKVEELFDVNKLSESSLRKYQVSNNLSRVTTVSTVLRGNWKQKLRSISSMIWKSTQMKSSRSYWSSRENKKEARWEAPDLPEHHYDLPTLLIWSSKIHIFNLTHTMAVIITFFSCAPVFHSIFWCPAFKFQGHR